MPRTGRVDAGRVRPSVLFNEEPGLRRQPLGKHLAAHSSVGPGRRHPGIFAGRGVSMALLRAPPAPRVSKFLPRSPYADHLRARSQWQDPHQVKQEPAGVVVPVRSSPPGIASGGRGLHLSHASRQSARGPLRSKPRNGSKPASHSVRVASIQASTPAARLLYRSRSPSVRSAWAAPVCRSNRGRLQGRLVAPETSPRPGSRRRRTSRSCGASGPCRAVF